MLMEADRRNDREEELLLHDPSIAEFECEMLKNPKTKQNSNIPIPNVQKLNSKLTEVKGDLSINFSGV